MNRSFNLKIFYSVGIISLVTLLAGIVFDYPWIGLIPFVIIALILLIVKLDIFYLLLAALIPLSVNFDDIGLGLGISLPDEPIIILIMVLTVIKFILNNEIENRIFSHPISIAIGINILWVFITIWSSEFPMVSIKFFLSRFWYVVVFYLLGIMFFRKYRNIRYFMWFYMIPLGAIIIVTLLKHASSGFSRGQSYTVMQPFFINHGIYAATICIFIPLLVIYILFFKKMKLNFIEWGLSVMILIVFVTGVYYSYTRAAWLGLAATAAFIVPVVLRIKFNTMILLGLISILFVFANQDSIIRTLSKNSHKSANGIDKHWQSISNIKTDPSNTERINRWVSAISMFNERPIMGFGPGTFSFCYAPYQEFKYKTIISTNFGDLGNAHSEYLNPLAEMGLPGLLSILFVFYIVLNTGLRIYFSDSKPNIRLMSLAIVLGLISYLVHGFLNDYSDSDKVGAMLWASYGMIAGMDLYHSKQKEKKSSNHELQ